MIDELKEQWDESLSTEQMEALIAKLDSAITNAQTPLQSAKMDLHQYDDQLRAKRSKMLSGPTKKVKKAKSMQQKWQRRVNRKMLKEGDPRGKKKMQDDHYDQITHAARDVDKANETAGESYEELLEQKNTILGFSTHIGNINTSIALSERYLRMMRDRDKRHRCYVALMISGMFLVIICAAIGFFAN